MSNKRYDGHRINMGEILAWDDLHDKWLAEAILNLMDRVDYFQERIEKLEMSNCTCLKPCPICKGLPVGRVEDALVHSAAHSNCLIHKKERCPSKDELMSDEMSDEIDLKAELKLELDHLHKQIHEDKPHKWGSAFRLFSNIVESPLWRDDDVER